MNAAKKEVNINIGGSPRDDWREWAMSTTNTSMPIRYQLSPLVELVARIDSAKAQLFEQAVADYVDAYGKTLLVSIEPEATVLYVQLRYQMIVPHAMSATIRCMIGKPHDYFIDMSVCKGSVSTNLCEGSYDFRVPPQYRVRFDSFVGMVPVGIQLFAGMQSVEIIKIQSFAIMLDWSVLPLDNEYWYKTLVANDTYWSVNPIK